MSKLQLEIVGMIYKSPTYLVMLCDQLKNNCVSELCDVHVRIVANDASPKILQMLAELDIPYSIYNDPEPNDYYLNRVYRAWNYSVMSSICSDVILVNSDMVFSNGWIDNLVKHHNGINIPCSRLVESGKLKSGKYALSKNFGRSAQTVDYNSWNEFAKKISNPITPAGGLFMPCLFNKQRFIDSGMYPEGNIYVNGAGKINLQNRFDGFLKSGDEHFFYDILQTKYNMKHITVFDSLVYHIQEGELDE